MSRDDPSRSRGNTADPVASALADLEGESQILVMAAGSTDAAGGVCRTLLTPPDGETEQAVLLSLTDSADGCLDRLGDPTGLTRVHVITTRQGSSATTVTADDTTEIVTQRVSDPSDLPRLGITTSRAVTDVDVGGRIRVCIDSLTAMLQYAERGRVYRFVQVLQDRLDQSDTVTHYHMNPAAHDQQTIETLRQLFDAIVRVSGDGTVEVAE